MNIEHDKLSIKNAGFCNIDQFFQQFQFVFYVGRQVFFFQLLYGLLFQTVYTDTKCKVVFTNYVLQTQHDGRYFLRNLIILLRKSYIYTQNKICTYVYIKYTIIKDMHAYFFRCKGNAHKKEHFKFFSLSFVVVVYFFTTTNK